MLQGRLKYNAGISAIQAKELWTIFQKKILDDMFTKKIPVLATADKILQAICYKVYDNSEKK